MSFTGFPKETAAFLKGIAAHNEKAWFEDNRVLYEAGYVEPATAFVDELGPRLRKIAPGVHFEPKINGSISRINRDVRFSKDKRPYKTHLSMWFWNGDKKGWNIPGFWFQLGIDEVHLGTGIYMFEKQMLASFREAIVHPRSGKALVAAIAAIRLKGPYTFGEKTRKLMPRGFEAPPERAEYLLYEGLHAGTQMPASAATKPDFLERCLEHYSNTWPISKWILDEVG